MATHNEPERAPAHGAEPGRGAPPPTGAEPPRGASPHAGAEPPRGEPPQAGTRPSPEASPHAAAEPAGSAASAAGEASGQESSTVRDRAASATGQAVSPPVSASDAVPPEAEENIAAELDAKIAELEDRWLRAVADLDNLRKRMARDIDRTRAEERVRVAREFLPVLDNLDLALEHADADPAAVAEGVRAIRQQAVDVLARLGYPRLDEEGVPFDPARHDAVSTAADAEAEPGTIFKVLRPGYGDGEHWLRPAMVVVATGTGQGGS